MRGYEMELGVLLLGLVGVDLFLAELQACLQLFNDLVVLFDERNQLGAVASKQSWYF